MKRPEDPLLVRLAGLPSPFLLGVSGGCDSCALLHAAVTAGLSPVVLHFDHGWRKTGAVESRFVRALAKCHGLSCVTGKAPADAAHNESTARRQRWAFFRRAAKRLGIDRIVLAHHADDQAETFLLQLLRGTGSGWHGMAATSVQEGLTVHRPWLEVGRREIEAYARAEGLAWHDDPTNLDQGPLRNRLRHRLIPLLEAEFEPAVRARLGRAAEIQRANQEWLDALVAEEARAERLPVARLRALPVGHQRHLLRAWLRGRKIADLSFADIEAARGLLFRERPARINLSGGFHLRRQSGFMFISSKK